MVWMFHVKHLQDERKGASNEKEENRVPSDDGPSFNPDDTIYGLDLYASGLVVIRRHGGRVSPNGGERSNITKFTSKARAKMLATIINSEVKMMSMITLTYGIESPVSGKAAKEHLRRFLQELRRKYDAEYFWFLEFQKRGSPHFHILCDVQCVDFMDRLWLAGCWLRILSLSDERKYSRISDRSVRCLSDDMYAVAAHKKTWQDVNSKDGAVRYTAKYALKTQQKCVPKQYLNVGRFWGCSRGVRVGLDVSLEIRDISAPVIRELLTSEGHAASSFDYLPTYLFGCSSLSLDSDVIIEMSGATDI